MDGEGSHTASWIVIRACGFGISTATCSFARQIPEEEAAVQRQVPGRGRAGFVLVSIAGSRRGNLGSRNVPTERISAPVTLRRASSETLVSSKGKPGGLSRTGVTKSTNWR